MSTAPATAPAKPAHHARRPLVTESLARLRGLGVPVGTVVDVGVLSGTPDLMAAFPDRKHLLIEPITEWQPTIAAAYGKAGITHEVIAVAAAERDGTMPMETSTVLPGVPISHARLTDAPRQGLGRRDVPVRRLDTLLPERKAATPYLLKIDVDGAELDILRGAAGILPDCSIVVVEANVQTFLPRAAAVVQAGFQLFDIVDPCYYDGRLRAFDFVFLNERTIAAMGIDMYKEKFDTAKWYVYR